MQERRLERVRELVKRAASEILRLEVPQVDCGLVAVNDVKVARDLQSALIFVGTIGTADQRKRALAFLDKETKRLQNLIGDKVQLRYTAKIKFVHDDSVERGNRVLAILDELENSPKP